MPKSRTSAKSIGATKASAAPKGPDAGAPAAVPKARVSASAPTPPHPLIAAAANTPDAVPTQPTTPADVEMVTAVVPRGFKLTTDDHVMHEYKAGEQEMPRSHAEHVYALAHGVSVK